MSSLFLRTPARDCPAEEHAGSLPSAPRTVDSSLGPWPAAAEPKSPSPRHMLDTPVRFASARLDAPYKAQVWLNTPVEGAPDAVHIRPSDTTAEIAVSVLASPVTGDWWNTHAVELLAGSIAAQNAQARQKNAATPVTTIAQVPGPFGIEVHCTHPLSAHPTPAGDWAGSSAGGAVLRDVVIIGCSRPRWSIKLTIYGVDVTDTDIDYAHQIAASMIVTRDTTPIPPGTPLPMGLLR
ncbi:DUF3710 domain-containing protein [Corynebacterium sp. AOP12-C2-36]|uniref:DUF3710 domain-containing protein n=1 Tax=Corynebacterium sp. AOP12-C2-36 TaxID=3457723 RepID=UPI004034BB0B